MAEEFEQDHNQERAEAQEESPALGYAHDVEPDHDQEEKWDKGEVGNAPVTNKVKKQVASVDALHPEEVTEVKDELPSNVAPKLHAEYEEKPLVQTQNETLTDAHPTGYVPASPDDVKTEKVFAGDYDGPKDE